MDKSNYQEIEKLIQQNSVISGFDLYYLGFFSYYVQKISLEDTFKHLSNIINLHHDHLITSEVKIDLLIKMLSNKIDFLMLNIIPAETEGDIEGETKKVLNEYFIQIMNIIPKYTSISKFELFYLGRFHAIYPSYKIAELFQHINNINTLVSEDLIDEETQIDFLLKILNKKLKSNDNKNTVLNIPKDDPSGKDQSSENIKQEQTLEEEALSGPQRTGEAVRQLGEQQNKNIKSKLESASAEPLEPQIEKPLNKNITEFQANFSEKDLNLENDENKTEEKKKPKEQDVRIDDNLDSNGVNKNQTERKVRNQMEIEKPISPNQNKIHDEEERDKNSKSSSIQGENMEQKCAEFTENFEEESKLRLLEQEVEREDDQAILYLDQGHKNGEQKDIEENSSKEFRAAPTRNDYQATLFVAEDQIDHQGTNITEESGREINNNKSINNEEDVNQLRENQSSKEKHSERGENSELDQERMQEEGVENNYGNTIEEEDQNRNIRKNENSIDLEPYDHNEGANENEERDLSFENERRNVEEEKGKSIDPSQHTHIDQDNNKSKEQNIPQKDSQQMKDSYLSISEKKPENSSHHSSAIDENDRKNEINNRSIDKNSNEILSANLEEDRDNFLNNEDEKESNNRIITVNIQSLNHKEDDNLGAEHPRDESLESHESTQNLVSKLYPETNKEHKMGTLDEILNNLLDDDKSDDNQMSQQKETFTRKQNAENLTKAENNKSLNSRKEDVSEKEKASQQSSGIPNRMQIEERTSTNENKSKSIHNTLPEQPQMEIEESKKHHNNTNDIIISENIQSQSSEYQRSNSEYQGSSQVMRSANMVIPESQFSQPDQSLILRWKKHQPENQLRRIGTEEESVLEEPSSHTQESNVQTTTIKHESTQLKAILEAATQADDPEEDESFEAPPSKNSQNIEQKHQNPNKTEVQNVEKTDNMDIEVRNQQQKQQTEKDIKLEFKADTIANLLETHEQLRSRPQTQKDQNQVLADANKPINQRNMEPIQSRNEILPLRDQIPQIAIRSDPKEVHQTRTEQEKSQNANQKAAESPHQSVNQNKTCIICIKDLLAKPTKTFEVCKDNFHEDCMRDYLVEKIDEKTYPIECPQQNCKQKLRLVDIMDFLNHEYLEGYTKVVLKIYVDQNNNISCCPTPGCSYAFFKKNQTKFQCPVCKKTYCLNCHMEWHQGNPCSFYEEQKLRRENQPEMILENGQSSKFKRCLKCDNWVAKRQGFNTLHCQCGSKFCYTCGKEREDRNCDCLRNQSFQPIVHTEVFHDVKELNRAMQTPENFKNFNKNQLEFENQSSRQPSNRNQSQMAQSFKPQPGQNASTSRGRNALAMNTAMNDDESDDLSYKGGNSPKNKTNEISDDELSYEGDQNKPKEDEDNDLSYQGDERKSIEEDDISYKGDTDKSKDDDDISYQGDDRRRIEDDDISYKGDQDNPKDEDDISYKGEERKAIEDDDISYKGSPKRNNDVDSDISA